MSKSPPLKVWQENSLKITKDVFENPNGYLRKLVTKLGWEVTALRESKNPSVVEIGNVLFLAEFVNKEIDYWQNTFYKPDSKLAEKSLEYMHTDEFREKFHELKQKRDENYKMLYEWVEKTDKQKIIDSAFEYTDYLLRFVKFEEKESVVSKIANFIQRLIRKRTRWSN